MTQKKLHYEHLGGLLIRRDELLHWRCPDCKKWGGSKNVMATCPHCGNVKAKSPIEPVKIPPTIAQSIRNAAINWPKYLGDVECQIIDSFVGTYERSRWRPNSVMFAESINTARTFMLLVAEALE